MDNITITSDESTGKVQIIVDKKYGEIVYILNAKSDGELTVSGQYVNKRKSEHLDSLVVVPVDGNTIRLMV